MAFAFRSISLASESNLSLGTVVARPRNKVDYSLVGFRSIEWPGTRSESGAPMQNGRSGLTPSGSVATIGRVSDQGSRFRLMIALVLRNTANRCRARAVFRPAEVRI